VHGGVGPGGELRSACRAFLGKPREVLELFPVARLMSERKIGRISELS